MNLPMDHKPKHEPDAKPNVLSIAVTIPHRLTTKGKLQILIFFPPPLSLLVLTFSSDILCVWIALIARYTAEKNVILRCQLQKEADMVPVHLEIPETFMLLQERLSRALLKSQEVNASI